MIDADVTIACENARLHLLTCHPVREIVPVGVKQVRIDVRLLGLPAILKSTLIAFIVAFFVAFVKATVATDYNIGSTRFGNGTITLWIRPRAVEYLILAVVNKDSAFPGLLVEINSLMDADASLAGRLVLIEDTRLIFIHYEVNIVVILIGRVALMLHSLMELQAHVILPLAEAIQGMAEISAIVTYNLRELVGPSTPVVVNREFLDHVGGVHDVDTIVEVIVRLTIV